MGSEYFESGVSDEGEREYMTYLSNIIVAFPKDPALSQSHKLYLLFTVAAALQDW